MRINAIHSRVLSTAAHPDQATYEEDAGLILPDRFTREQTGFVGRVDDRHRCVYPRDRSTVLVAVEADNGLVGYGEAHAPVAPRVAHTIVVDLLAPVLLGQDARQIQVLWEQMFSAMRLRSHTMGFTAEAIAGVDLALWDLLGKYREEPVWMLLGGAHRRRLPVYSSGVPGATAEEQVQSIEGILARGFSAVKCSCGRGSLHEQMDLVRPLSEALGDRGKLLVDAHGAFDLNDALRFARFLQDLGNVEWFEDALVPEDADSYARLTEATPGLRIAMGETECNRYGARDRLLTRQCDVLLPDVCRAGGITETWRIAQLADTFGILWASHVSVSTPLHLAAGLHIGAATPNFLASEYPASFDDSSLGRALCTASPAPEGGSIEVTDAPGLGVTLDESQIERLTALRESRRVSDRIDLTGEMAMAVDSTQDAPNWVCATREAAWQARDSQGEFVYDDHLWILGGWFTPQTPNPRDVWKSPDGKQWTCTVEVAPWEYSDLPASMVFEDKMWMMGGRKLPGAKNCNEVWSSTDGAEWTLETEHAGWCPRVSPSFAVFKGRMWIMGGTENFYDDNDRTLKNDVWSSADGREWKLEVQHAGWSKRTHAQAVVFEDKIWIMGGGHWHPETIPVNDVWCSEDGVNWTQVTDAAPWKPRMWFSLVVYRDRMWVLGGWSKVDGNYGDVWYSKDGANWTELKSDVIWTPRHEHSAYVFQDKIWVAGGYAESLDSQVWSLEIPETWCGDM